MEQSPSWEANRFSASHEIPHILWNLEVRCPSARHLSLSWARPIQTMPPMPLPDGPSYYYPPIYVCVSQVDSSP